MRVTSFSWSRQPVHRLAPVVSFMVQQILQAYSACMRLPHSFVQDRAHARERAAQHTDLSLDSYDHMTCRCIFVQSSCPGVVGLDYSWLPSECNMLVNDVACNPTLYMGMHST